MANGRHNADGITLVIEHTRHIILDCFVLLCPPRSALPRLPLPSLPPLLPLPPPLPFPPLSGVCHGHRKYHHCQRHTRRPCGQPTQKRKYRRFTTSITPITSIRTSSSVSFPPPPRASSSTSATSSAATTRQCVHHTTHVHR